ncbi:MAG: hypothetical protein QF632_05740 [Candidatus Woesearchaeota archaeon]|jgi:Na+-translocating ferredoxin:NAD+ oxidoreductase RnfD subunit|nr:hypothetical protein [Candidatus Woesearchaeota archaeon]MDP7324234.1 hypothetical protein [Candidatus Woesearchaeota archaeon]MDP7457561.1 hypothetical protein [Candidatus Woesearchaeota archaeon]
MGLFEWADSKIPLLRWYDVSFIKMSTLFATLFLAKVIPDILGLEWYWYLILCLVFAVPVMKKMFSGGNQEI